MSHAAALSAVERADADKPKTASSPAARSTNPGERRGGAHLGSWTTCWLIRTGARSWACPVTASAATSSLAEFGLEVGNGWSSWPTALAVDLPYVDEGVGRSVSSGPISRAADTRGDRGCHRLARGAGAEPAAIGYRLEDWLLSRQRYWGLPDPDRLRRLRDGAGAGRHFPILLPEVTEYLPKGRSPLRRPRGLGAGDVSPRCRRVRRETDTMDTFIASSLAATRYAGARNDEAPFARRKWDYWLPVASTSAASSTPSSIYSTRFFTKV